MRALKIIGTIFLFISVVILAIYFIVSEIKGQNEFGSYAYGSVVDYEEYVGKNGKGYSAAVEFSANDGENYQVVADFGTKEPVVGERVGVCYSTENPVYAEAEISRTVHVSFYIGTGMMMAGTIMVVTAYWPKKKEELLEGSETN